MILYIGPKDFVSALDQQKKLSAVETGSKHSSEGHDCQVCRSVCEGKLLLDSSNELEAAPATNIGCPSLQLFDKICNYLFPSLSTNNRSQYITTVCHVVWDIQ